MYVKDERLERGVIELEAGKSHLLSFNIPTQMKTTEIKRGDWLGSLLFDRAIKFRPYDIMGIYTLNNIQKIFLH